MELAWWGWYLLLFEIYLVTAPAVVVMWLILRDRDV